MALDLCNPSPAVLMAFTNAVVEMAVNDFGSGRKRMRSGEDICEHLCTDYRNGHKKMASHLYAKTHWTLTVAAKERAEGGL